MEPFVTKDGKYLLFNNLNEPSVNTNLYYAARIDDLTFDYKGEIAGVNTASLEGVPSVDRNGMLYFVLPHHAKEPDDAVFSSTTHSSH